MELRTQAYIATAVAIQLLVFMMFRLNGVCALTRTEWGTVAWLGLPYLFLAELFLRAHTVCLLALPIVGV